MVRFGEKAKIKKREIWIKVVVVLLQLYHYLPLSQYLQSQVRWMFVQQYLIPQQNPVKTLHWYETCILHRAVIQSSLRQKSSKGYGVKSWEG